MLVAEPVHESIHQVTSPAGLALETDVPASCYISWHSPACCLYQRLQNNASLAVLACSRRHLLSAHLAKLSQLSYAQAWGLLVEPDQGDPLVTISFNASSQVNLTHAFPGDLRVRDDHLHLPSHLTADVSNVYPVRGSWEVTIKGMDGIHVFDAGLCQPDPHARAPSTVIALRPFLSSDLKAAAVLLVHHITYHMCKNVQLHHVYVEPGQASILLQRPLSSWQLNQLHRLHHVVFFEWPLRMFSGTVGGDWYGGQPIQVRVQYWQVILHNHALLAYWGSHAKVALIDIDEFLLGPVFMAGKSVACMQHIYMACRDCQPGSTEFLQVWNRSSTSQALAQYKVAGYSEDSGSHAKCWVLADEVVSFAVHWPAQGEGEVYRPSVDIAGLMHFTSMWSERQSSRDSKQELILDTNAYDAEDFHRCLAENFPFSRHHDISS